ncbi:AAA family ATPase [Mucilaginibacter sp. CSA2-8R]|uniref:AAA family ATPase n=1 Tax=Mucilaginibacter sp. CSA2-8R TaxID=3141542 RepID=UPI00315DD903
MKIHIMGASGAGSTTLGKALSERWKHPYFDTDDYFWLSSAMPFTQRRAAEERNRFLKDDLQKHKDVIVGGSLVNWGDEWKTYFNLVVFLYLPPAIRLQRLMEREVERYGTAIFDNPERAALYQQFLTWATGYDDNTTHGRTLNTHRNWLSALDCPVLEIEGDTTIDERVNLVEQTLSGFLKF